MGFYYRKSIDLGPFRINISKSGIGFSIGTKGFRTGVRTDGRRYTSASLPGTGLRYLGGGSSALGLLATIFGGSDSEQPEPDRPRFQRRLRQSAAEDFYPPEDDASDEESEAADPVIQGLEELLREQDRKAERKAPDPVMQQLEALVKQQDRKAKRRRRS